MAHRNSDWPRLGNVSSTWVRSFQRGIVLRVRDARDRGAGSGGWPGRRGIDSLGIGTIRGISRVGRQRSRASAVGRVRRRRDSPHPAPDRESKLRPRSWPRLPDGCRTTIVRMRRRHRVQQARRRGPQDFHGLATRRSPTFPPPRTRGAEIVGARTWRRAGSTRHEAAYPARGTVPACPCLPGSADRYMHRGRKEGLHGTSNPAGVVWKRSGRRRLVSRAVIAAPRPPAPSSRRRSASAEARSPPRHRGSAR